MKIALPEQITIDYKPAGFGSRSLAYTCDFCLRWSIILIIGLIGLYLLMLTNSFAGALASLEFGIAGGMTRRLIIAGGILVIFSIEWGYPVVFEIFNGGITPGKKLLGLRVVDESGLPVTLAASFIRNILLIVDLIPGTGGIALCFMSLSQRSQRLGDLVARTLVVYDAPLLLPIPESPSEISQQIPIPESLYSAIQIWSNRKRDLNSEARSDLATKLLSYASNFSEAIVSEKPDGMDDATYLDIIVYRLIPVRHLDTVSRDKIVWKRIERSIAEADLSLGILAESKHNLSHQEIQSVARNYQRLCQDYAALTTFYSDLPQSELAAHLVRVGRRLIYGKRLSRVSELKTNFIRRVQDSYQKVKFHIVASTSLCAIGAILAWCAVAIHPDLAFRFITEETAAALSRGEIWTDAVRGLGSIGSAHIMTNNITVAFTAFALGITGGVGTVLVLLFNGASLGGVFQALTQYGMAHRLLEFILAHGFLELSIIFVAGGCGLYLADGFLRPGAKTRLLSLQEHARVSADLLIFSAVWLIPAGITEGYISPNSDIPIVVKVIIGVSLALGYWGVVMRAFWPALTSVNHLAPSQPIYIKPDLKY